MFVSISSSPAGLAIRGRVARAGEPVAGVFVAAVGLDVVGRTRALTDPGGWFELAALPAGRYRLQVSTANQRVLHEQLLALEADRDLAIELPAGLVQGSVVDADSSASIAGCRLLFTSAATNESRRVESDAAGQFTISLDPGDWTLRATAAGYESAVEAVSVDENGAAAVDVRLRGGSGLLLRVAGANATSVTFNVLDGNGRTVDGGSALIREDGTVRLASIPEGQWLLLVSALGSSVVEQLVTVPGDVDVTLLPQATVSLHVAALADSDLLATATVTNAAGGPFRSPRPGGPVAAWNLPRGRGVIPGLGPGAWTIHLSTADGQRWSARVHLSAGASERVVLP